MRHQFLVLNGLLWVGLLTLPVCARGADELPPLPPPPPPTNPDSRDSTKEPPTVKDEGRTRTVLLLKGGESLRGIVASETADTILFRPEGGNTIAVPKAEIAARTDIRDSGSEKVGAPAKPVDPKSREELESLLDQLGSREKDAAGLSAAPEGLVDDIRKLRQEIRDALAQTVRELTPADVKRLSENASALERRTFKALKDQSLASFPGKREGSEPALDPQIAAVLNDERRKRDEELALLVRANASSAAGYEPDLDLIVRFDVATPTRLKVTAEDFLFVEGRSEDATVKLPSYKVNDILRAERPQDYNIGLERLFEGRYAVAAKYFTEVMRGKAQKDKPWAVECCNYRLAEALYQGGFWDGYRGRTYNYSPPAEYYAQVLKANPRSRFLLDASVKLPICLLEQKKSAEAEEALAKAAANIARYREETAKTGDPEYRKLADRAEAMLNAGRALLTVVRAQKQP